ncbi:MAG: helix-turn-helix transcriptional regulator [Clostridia bacterium]|nr:helix-turn-helix transcriptional regulator [Clostridia bacterium]
MNKAKNNYNANSTFPVRLRALMEEHDVKQTQLAEICEVQRQAVAQWTAGNTRPDILSLSKIAAFFNVTSDYLVGLTDNKTTDKATLEICQTIGLNDRSVDFLLNPENEYLRRGIDLLIRQHVEAYPDDETEPLHACSILQSLTSLLSMAESGEDAFINYTDGTIEGKSGDIENVNLRMPKIREIIYTNPDQRRHISLFEAESLIEKNNIDCALSEIIFRTYSRNIVKRYKEGQKQNDETT